MWRRSHEIIFKVVFILLVRKSTGQGTNQGCEKRREVRCVHLEHRMVAGFVSGVQAVFARELGPDRSDFRV
jgi:hypothetical protein